MRRMYFALSSFVVVLAVLAAVSSPAAAQPAEESEEMAAETGEAVHEEDVVHNEEGAAGDHAEGDGHSAEGGAPLEWKADLALWSLVVFLLFLFLLGKFAWAPLSAGLNERESRIRSDIAAAEESRKKSEQMLAEHAEKLDKVQDEVREIIAEARRDAEHTKQDIIAEAQREAEATKQRAVAEIGRARDAALKDLFDSMSGQVVAATEHVLGRSVNESDQDRLIDEALARFQQPKF